MSWVEREVSPKCIGCAEEKSPDTPMWFSKKEKFSDFSYRNANDAIAVV